MTYNAIMTFKNGEYLNMGLTTRPQIVTDPTKPPRYVPLFDLSKVNKHFDKSDIANVEFYPPATKMTFADGTVTTSVAQDGDEFNKETGMLHCIMKYIFRDNSYNNMLRKWIRHADDIEADKVEFARRLEEEKQIAERQEAKKARQKARKAERAKERQIEIQKEAYIRAMKEMKKTEDDKNAGTAE